MKFTCFGYIDETKWDKLSQDEQSQILEDYFKFYEQLKKDKIFLGGTGLKSVAEATNVSLVNGELKYNFLQPDIEQIGGYFIIQADNLETAKLIISKHPGLKVGSFDIRPIDEEITKLVGAQ